MLHWIVRGYYWLAERLYNELAFIYDPVSWLVSLGHWDKLRKWALDYIPGKRVLEIGFGTGELLIEMKRRGLDAFGVELSPAMQRQVTGKLKRRGLYVPRTRGRAAGTAAITSAGRGCCARRWPRSATPRVTGSSLPAG